MCGVIGYVGEPQDPNFLYDGLKRLEYRGYDSAGITMIADSEVYLQRAEGKLNNLRAKLGHMPDLAPIGMGHTRWATHGAPTERNAHPHASRNLVLLHNGIVENYRELKRRVMDAGYEILSETDTEVAAHYLDLLIAEQDASIDFETRVETALQKIFRDLRGSYALGIIFLQQPDKLYVMKMGSPVVLGRAENLSLMASGVTALVDHTQQLLFMEDSEYAILSRDGIELKDMSGQSIERKFEHVNWTPAMIEKGGYRHFMLKEIFDQPIALAETLTGRVSRVDGHVDLADLGIAGIEKRPVDVIHIIACGTSYYAGILARYTLEEYLKVPVMVELASEYRYKANTAREGVLAIAISQSGETADTLHAIKSARAHGATTLALVNMVGSTIGQACDYTTMMRAGPEIGVASTKAFTAQVLSLYLIGLALAQEHKILTSQDVCREVELLSRVPRYVEAVLGRSAVIEKIAHDYKNLQSILYIGRGPNYAIALEGALKLKELSYIHAEGYAAGELKHGPIALIDENMVTVAVCPKDRYREKTLSNIEEIKARNGRILAIGNEDDPDLKSISDEIIELPDVDSRILPFVLAVPIQLFSYWVAVHKGTDVDQPRNLAKSVTVE